MAPRRPYHIPLPLLHNLWFASLTGPPCTILSTQEALLRAILDLPYSTFLDKVSTTLFLNIALLHAFHGALHLAGQSFAEAIIRSPHCALAHYGLGLTWFLRAHNVDAIRAWQACVASFELVTPEGFKNGEWVGRDEIRYQMWKPDWHAQAEKDEEDQPENERGIGSKKVDKHIEEWALNKDAVLWNIYVAKKAWKKNLDSLYDPDKIPDLDDERKMHFVNGIPAGMLFGPPFELPRRIHAQPKEKIGQYEHGPAEFARAYTHPPDRVPTYSALLSRVTQLASNSVQDYEPPTEGNDAAGAGISSSLVSSTTKRKDEQPVSTSHNRGRSPTAPFQKAPQAAQPERSSSRQVAPSSARNNQATIMPSSHHKQHRSRSRTIDEAGPSGHIGMRKPLPPLPHVLPSLPDLDSRSYSMPLPQPALVPILPRAPSTNPLSFARLFTKSKRGQLSSGPSGITGVHAGAGTGVGGSIIASHSTPVHGSITSGIRAAFGDSSRGKDKGYRPRRPDPPADGFSLHGLQKGNPTYAKSADRAGKTDYLSLTTIMSSKTEWEKRMEQGVRADIEAHKRLYFPREEIGVQQELGAGVGLGLGLPSRGGGTVTAIPIPNPNQNRSLPALLPMAYTAPVTVEKSEYGIRGSNRPREDRVRELALREHEVSSRGAASSATGSSSRMPREDRFRGLALHEHGISADSTSISNAARPMAKDGPYSNLDTKNPAISTAPSLPVFPKRTSSLIAASPISPPPPYPPPPPPTLQQQSQQPHQQSQRRGRRMSRLGLELEWDDEAGDFRFRQEEENEKDKHKNSSSSRTRIGNHNERRGRATLADTTTPNTTTTPYENRSHTPFHLTNFNNHSSHSHSRSRSGSGGGGGGGGIREQLNLPHQHHRHHHHFQSTYPTETQDEEAVEDYDYEDNDRKSEQSAQGQYESYQGKNYATPAPLPLPSHLLRYADQGVDERVDDDEGGEKSGEGKGEEAPQLQLLNAGVFQGFGGGVGGQWRNGKWI